MLITEVKFTEYFFVLKKLFVLHKKYNFGESPDIPSGFSESLCRHILDLDKGSDRTHDAISTDGKEVEIKATGTKQGKTTISNSNEFNLLIWVFIDFERDSVNLYKLPRNLFNISGTKGRSSITLSTIANSNNISPEIYTFASPS